MWWVAGLLGVCQDGGGNGDEDEEELQEEEKKYLFTPVIRTCRVFSSLVKGAMLRCANCEVLRL